MELLTESLFVGHTVSTRCRMAKLLKGTWPLVASASPTRVSVSMSVGVKSLDSSALEDSLGDDAVGEAGGEEEDADTAAANGDCASVVAATAVTSSSVLGLLGDAGLAGLAAAPAAAVSPAAAMLRSCRMSTGTAWASAKGGASCRRRGRFRYPAAAAAAAAAPASGGLWYCWCLWCRRGRGCSRGCGRCIRNMRPGIRGRGS